MALRTRTSSTAEAAARTVVGRADQLAELHAALDAALEGRTTTLLVGGDAGVGKTTLVDLFCAAQREAAVIRGQCVPLGGDGLAYAPVIGALRDLARQVGDGTLLDWAGPGAVSIGSLLPELAVADSLDSNRLRLLEAVTEVLEHASLRHPLVVVLEDIHWSDTSTRDLIAFVTRALTDARLLVVATYRSDELHRRHPLRPFLAELQRLHGVGSIDVPRLDRDGVAEMLAGLAPARDDAAFVDEVFRRSDGIPFFVEELAHTDCTDLPADLRNVLIVRFERLGPDAQSVVRLLAVAGDGARHDLLAAAGNLDPSALDAALREAVDAQLLVVDGAGYRFRHALLGEAVLDDLLPGETVALHRRVAETLEARPELAAAGTLAVSLAHHWYACHDLRQAFCWSLTAAREQPNEKAESLRHYERVLELWDEVGDAAELARRPHADVLEAAFDTAFDAGELLRALALADAALAEIDVSTSPLDASRLMVKKGRLLMNLVRPGAVELIERAVALVPPDPPSRERADAMAILAAMQLMAGDIPASIATSRVTIDTAIAADAPLAESSARITLATCIGGEGDLAAAREEFERGLQLAGDDDRLPLRMHINFSDTLRINGRYSEAVDVAMAGKKIAAELGLRRTHWVMLVGNATEPCLLLGQWEDAARLIRRGLELDPPAHHRVHLMSLHALHQVWTDELAAADRTLAELRPQLSADQPVPQYLSMVALAEAEYGLAVGDPARAWTAAKVALDERRRQAVGTLWWIARSGAEAIAAARRHGDEPPFDVDDSQRYLAAVMTEFDAVDPCPHGRALVEAELSDTLELWDRAVDALAAAEGPVHLGAHAHLQRARLLGGDGDRPGAGAASAAAGEIAGRVGARLIQRRIDDLTRRLGLRAVDADAPSDRTMSGLAALTPREREVLRLVSEGLSNGDIGAELFISTKTASVHVSNILAKLGVTTRTEAAALALRNPLVER